MLQENKIKTTIQEKRTLLKELSVNAKILVDIGTVETVNQGIILSYTNATHQEFKTFNQWLQLGYKVKRGETAFLIWCKPRKTNEENPTNDEYKFFPIAFLFSNAQVEVNSKIKPYEEVKL